VTARRGVDAENKAALTRTLVSRTKRGRSALIQDLLEDLGGQSVGLRLTGHPVHDVVEVPRRRLQSPPGLQQEKETNPATLVGAGVFVCLPRGIVDLDGNPAQTNRPISKAILTPHRNRALALAAGPEVALLADLRLRWRPDVEVAGGLSSTGRWGTRRGAWKERIGVRVRVSPLGKGRSRVRVMTG